MTAAWGDDVGINWANGSDLDFAVAEEAREAAEWLGPILAKRAGIEAP